MPAPAPASAPERGLVTSAVDPEVSAAIQIYDRLEPLKNALGIGDFSVPEMQLFAMVAHRTGLDPFTKQIYAIKRDGKVTHQTGIDGYRSVAERTGQYLGSDEATFEACPCGEKPADHPAVARVVVHRAHQSGHVVDQVGIARWHELKPAPGQSGRGDSMWQKMPYNQLAKCAEANGLRKAFPRVLGGVYIAEEMAQAGPAEAAPLVEAAAQPTAAGRLAARRAAIETLVEHEPVSDGPGADQDPDAPTDTGATDVAAAGPAAGDEAQESEPAGLTPEEFAERCGALNVTARMAATKAKEMWPDYTAGTLTDERRLELAQALERERAESALL